MKRLDQEIPARSRAFPIDQPVQEQAMDVQADDLQEQVRKRAYEIYEQRAGSPGSEVEDWLQAESEILGDTRQLRKVV